VLHNFNLDRFNALYPRYAGGRPPTFALAQRRQIKQVALSRPVDHDLPFSTWSLDGTDDVLAGDPDVVICVDEFGPRNLQPHPGRQWATRGGGGVLLPRRRRQATWVGRWPTTSSWPTPRPTPYG
jgi:hypothetical protein